MTMNKILGVMIITAALYAVVYRVETLRNTVVGVDSAVWF